ncbi:unnamed protein product, partial [marine sediment metagenome]
KTLLLYDWIKGNKEMKSLEQEYFLYERDVLRLANGFCWLADSLAAIAESGCWKKKRKEDLKKIILLSERLIEGIEEEGLSLARLYILGLSRDYIRRLVRAGYGDVENLKKASEEELVKLVRLLPGRLIKGIQRRMDEERVIQEVKKQKLITEDENPKPEPAILPSPLKTTNTTSASHNLKLTSVVSSPPKTENPNSNLNTKNQKLKIVLEISQHRPDRIIFMGKEFKVTTIGFSLLYLLAEHREKVVSYEEILKDLWKGEKDAIYTRINYHICKIRKDISKIMDKKEDNTKKIENIFKAIPFGNSSNNSSRDRVSSISPSSPIAEEEVEGSNRAASHLAHRRVSALVEKKIKVGSFCLIKCLTVSNR